jgi:type II secretory pathway pseudopilin PulG
MHHLKHYRSTGLRARAAGLTIVEAAVAAAFLVICSVGVFSTLTRMQQSAITNRALTNSHNLLRTVIEQALSRGWDNEAAPLDILEPTIAGDTLPYNGASNVGDGTWKRWDVYRGIDASTGTDPIVPIYEDVADVSKNVPARVFRKVQRVTGNQRLLWITFRIEYMLRGQLVGQEAWVTRAAD